MKILIVQDTDWIRRNPIQHTHLAERMALRGHEIRIDYEILWRTEGKKELFSKRQVFHVSRLIKEVSLPVIRPGILKITKSYGELKEKRSCFQKDRFSMFPDLLKR
jgi:hypothetical protein